MTDVLDHELPFPEPGTAADAAFVGIGEIPSGKFPDRTFMGALVEVSARAILDAGLAPRDIDTVLLIPCLHGGRDQADLIFSRLVEELGLNGRAKSSMMIHSGGSTSDSATRVAAGLVASGQARNVLIAQADKWGSAPVTEMVDMLSGFGIPREWEVPSGVTFNAVGGLITQRYMHATGSTAEEMASVCVALRQWARLNPNAMFKDKDLTIERVLTSKMISDPVHALECPMLADGAVALVMTSATSARRNHDSWVRIAGSGGTVSHYSLGQERDLAVMNWPRAGREAYEQAGWGPEDVDLAQVYDSYAAVLAQGLEGLGLAAEGEAARQFAAGRFSPGGELPANTNGGLLSAGHTGVGGGTALLAEGVRQLLWRAEPERQVEGATRAVIGGTGGTYMDSQVMLLERVTR
ncbi:acetyl-CoA acetyltransferase [Nocardioides sp. Root1257]|uniref:thiolase family protein n=1 Tax=unclassified Nocardioides TaxID=2615069 RepID=UPI0006FE63A4|nr:MULTISPECIES: thiolase family protein [unclassified Nocardioides]KQW45033.1 acetyl-CoA acetyltransferase [Nocardioides sp. Root1257]KRC45963.1 acetyl-CoA acetyltransferase [Nocardioides sp. Root224]